MKKFIIFLVLASALMTSCSQYTCATYAKSSRKKEISAHSSLNSYERGFTRMFADSMAAGTAKNSVSDIHKPV